eukprot:NODE_5033_length_1817_cov_4.524852.p1 GENE.NODE_5033_length_1817_cov_4.524852~~NODE_5033_length_1817_cov_4.524852.p1  ORF type:complete len:386 (+),score=117.25 NODE_5033_length_1817_cov_4.524852:602-1759(+)
MVKNRYSSALQKLSAGGEGEAARELADAFAKVSVEPPAFSSRGAGAGDCPASCAAVPAVVRELQHQQEEERWLREADVGGRGTTVNLLRIGQEAALERRRLKEMLDSGLSAAGAGAGGSAGAGGAGGATASRSASTGGGGGGGRAGGGGRGGVGGGSHSREGSAVQRVIDQSKLSEVFRAAERGESLAFATSAHDHSLTSNGEHRVAGEASSALTLRPASPVNRLLRGWHTAFDTWRGGSPVRSGSRARSKSREASLIQDVASRGYGSPRHNDVQQQQPPQQPQQPPPPPPQESLNSIPTLRTPVLSPPASLAGNVLCPPSAGLGVLPVGHHHGASDVRNSGLSFYMSGPATPAPPGGARTLSLEPRARPHRLQSPGRPIGLRGT